jgi:type IV pilus assembly protein PilA
MFSSAIKRLNDRRHAAGEIGEDAGFTLIELMVVLLILAILLAIAIPTFLGVTKSANDRAAQSNLNTAFVNAKAAFQQNSQAYAGSVALAASLVSAEPSLSFITGATQLTTGTAQSTVSVTTASDGNAVIMAVLSKGTGNCWYLIDNTQGEGTGTANVPYNGSTFVAPVSTSVASTGTGFPFTAGTWYGEWKNTSALVPTCEATVAPTVAGTGTATSTVSFQSTGGFPSL